MGDGRGQDELEEEDEIAELEQRLMSSKLPEHALKAAKKELKVYASLYMCTHTHTHTHTYCTVAVKKPSFSIS